MQTTSSTPERDLLARRARAAVAGAAAFTAAQLTATVIAVVDLVGPRDGIDGILLAIDGVSFAVLLVAFVLTGRWLSTARQVAVRLAPGTHHARSATWVWWGWVVPVVNLWFPYQVVRDVWRGTEHAAGGAPRRPPLGTWFALWLVQGLVAVPAGGPSLGRVADVSLVVAGAVLLLLALPRWLDVVRRTADAQLGVLGGREAGTLLRP